jgi:hypothetical protein
MKRILVAPLLLVGLFLIGLSMLILDIVTGVQSLARWVITGDE